LTFVPSFALISHKPLAMKKLISLAPALLIAALLVGCGNNSQPPAPGKATPDGSSTGPAPGSLPSPEPPAIAEDITPGKQGGRLVIATIGDPKTFNPVVANEESSTEVYRLLYSRLARFDWVSQTAKPDLAYEWSVAEDNRTWTYKLRRNLFWSDGHPLTARDVVFTWNDIIYNPDIPNVMADAFTVAGKQFTVSMIDEHTVQIVTPIPYAPFVDFVGDVEILPEHVLREAVRLHRFSSAYGINTQPSKLVTSGPYRLKEFKPGQYTLLERNPYYHRVDKNGARLPYIDNVIFTVTPDLNAMALRFKQGESDVHEVVRASDYDSFKELADQGRFQLFELGVGPEKAFLWFNLNTNRLARLKLTGTPKPGAGDSSTNRVEVNWNNTGLGKLPQEKTLPIGRVKLVAAYAGKRQTNMVDVPKGAALPLKFEFDFCTIEINSESGEVDARPVVAPTKLTWFSDRRFRQAISHAIDRAAIIKSIYGGKADYNFSYISPANKRWHNPNVQKYPFDPAKARALLAEMGIRDRDGDGKLEDAKGNRIAFVMNTNTGNTDREKIGVLIQEDLKRLGIDLTFQPVEFNALVDKLQVSLDYDCILLGLGGGFLDPHASANVLTSSGFTHFWHPRQVTPATPWEARIDRIYELQVQELDYQKRKALIDEMQVILSRELPFIYTVQKYNYAAIRNGVGNLKPTPMYPFRLTWNLDELYFE